MPDNTAAFLSSIAPYDRFGPDELQRVVAQFEPVSAVKGEPIYTEGEPANGLYLILEGTVRVDDASGAQLSQLHSRNSFGERGLLKDGIAVTTATATSDTRLLRLSASDFAELRARNADFAAFFQRGEARLISAKPDDVWMTPLGTLMTPTPLTCPPGATAESAARKMADAKVSSLCVCDDEKLIGIVTTRDLSGRVLGAGRSSATKVADIMTADPVTLPIQSIGADVLDLMMQHGIGHVPVVTDNALVGIVTQTDLNRHQADTPAWLIRDIRHADSAAEIATITAGIPALLTRLAASGHRHDVITRLITDIADAATRRLLNLAEAELGTPPADYLWLACGSQGRREQTGVSDQDNCLFIDDSATDDDLRYFDTLATRVCDGLNLAGYVYCPGEMMASTQQWRQRYATWREYFHGWIRTPNPQAQMLSSVMFDLRPIGGSGQDRFAEFQAETLDAASRNTIFISHMVSNSLKHRPPLGLFGTLAPARFGAQRNRLDMKAGGVVPIVDLARLYALIAGITAVNSRARIEAAAGSQAVSESGARDLLDAYDVIAECRLRHQARQIAADQAPDNLLDTGALSGFERSHLRDAFVVVRTMQAGVAQGRGTLL